MASQYRRRSLMLNTIAKVAQGNPTIITDSSSRRLQKLNIYGQSSQDGTPSVENPIPIISKEVNEIRVRGKNKLPFPFGLFKEEKKINGMTFTPLEDGGIKLNGTCTARTIINLDKYPYDNKYRCTLWNTNGTPYQMGKNSLQMAHDYNNDLIYILIDTVGTVFNDLIVYPMESLVSMSNTYEPYKSQTITLTEPITLRGIPVESGGNVTIDGQQYIADVIKEKDGVVGVERNDGFIENYTNENVGDIYISTTGELSQGASILYPLSSPTFEPLPEEVQAQYKALKSYYPNTVIQTGCWNEVTYSAKRGG